MDTDDTVEKAWGAIGARWRGAKGGKMAESLILSTTNKF